MSFWELHEAAELEVAKAEELERARTRVARALPQNAPQQCSFCSHFGVDVLLGVCEDCSP